MTNLDRLDRYTQGMARLQRVWAYLLRRKQRRYQPQVVKVTE